MTTDPAEHAPRVVAAYQVRHAETKPLNVAQDVMSLLNDGNLLIDLSDHDRRADTVLLRTNGDNDDAPGDL